MNQLFRGFASAILAYSTIEIADLLMTLLDRLGLSLINMHDSEKR